LRLIDQHVDAHRLRPHGVDPSQRLGQHRAIEWRAFAGLDQRIIVINDQHDARIGIDAGRSGSAAKVVKDRFGVASEQKFPAEPCEQHRTAQHKEHRHQPHCAELTQDQPGALDQPARCAAKPHAQRVVNRRCAPSPTMAKPAQ